MKKPVLREPLDPFSAPGTWRHFLAAARKVSLAALLIGKLPAARASEASQSVN
jgi:hypothetical protein